MQDKTTKPINMEVPELNITGARIDEKIEKYQAQLKVLAGQAQTLRTQIQQRDTLLSENNARQQQHIGGLTILEELKADLSSLNGKGTDDAEIPEDAERV